MKGDKVDVYFGSLITTRCDNQTKYISPAKLLFINKNDINTFYYKCKFGNIQNHRWQNKGPKVYNNRREKEKKLFHTKQ